MLLYIIGKLFLSGVHRKGSFKFLLKGLLNKIHKKFTAFSDHYNGKSH